MHSRLGSSTHRIGILITTTSLHLSDFPTKPLTDISPLIPPTTSHLPLSHPPPLLLQSVRIGDFCKGLVVQTQMQMTKQMGDETVGK